ncbi:MAG: hypothetical protein H7222_09220, partial [Methylotenera sp.]|nr:hypothetical protein [Oligoflexia bacterium]
MKTLPALITVLTLSFIAFIVALQSRAGAERSLSSAPGITAPTPNPSETSSKVHSPTISTSQIQIDGTYSQMVIPFIFKNEEYVIEREETRGVSKQSISDPAFMDTPFGDRVNAVDLTPRLPKKRLILNVRNHSPQVASDVRMNIDVPKTLSGRIQINPESDEMVVISRPARRPGHAADEFDLDLFSKADFKDVWTFRSPTIEADGTVNLPISLQQREALNTLSFRLKVEHADSADSSFETQDEVVLEQSAEQLPSGLNYVVEMPVGSNEDGILQFNLSDLRNESGIYRLTPALGAERGSHYLNANLGQLKSDSVLW